MSFQLNCTFKKEKYLNKTIVYKVTFFPFFFLNCNDDFNTQTNVHMGKRVMLMNK